MYPFLLHSGDTYLCRLILLMELPYLPIYIYILKSISLILSALFCSDELLGVVLQLVDVQLLLGCLVCNPWACLHPRELRLGVGVRGPHSRAHPLPILILPGHPDLSAQGQDQEPRKRSHSCSSYSLQESEASTAR